MCRILLVAVDLDGTLLTSQRTLAPEGARLLKVAARGGIRVVLATTRNPDTVRPFCCQLEIDDPMICTNGAQVWGSPGGPIWSCRTMSRDTGSAIARLADEHGWELSTTVGSSTYWRQRPGQALGPIAPGLTIVRSNADAMTGRPVRILVSQPDAIQGIRSFCESRLANQCRTETYCDPDGTEHSLGVFPVQADKGTALALVCRRLGIGREQTMAIGDNPNDVPMFAWARISVAMGNAPAEVIESACIVAPEHDNEGVAWAIRRFVLSQM